MVAAIASRDEKRAAALARRINAPHAFGSYEEMLASDAVDGDLHSPADRPACRMGNQGRGAADAGKHVLVEKPLAMTAGEIDGVIAARDRNGVVGLRKPSWSSTTPNGTGFVN